MLYLKASEDDVPLELPDGTRDIVTASREVKDINGPLNIPPEAITVMRVKTGHFTLNAAVNTLRMANKLYVTFHGARRTEKDEHKNTSPMFIRRDWHELYNAPILSISDPIAEKVWGAGLPRISMYFGTFANDLIPETNALIDKVCDELGISRDNVVMYGASSGGTAALLTAAARDYKSSAIAVCPFLRPDKYREQMVAMASRAMGGTSDDWANTMSRRPNRVNPITAMRAAIQSKPDFRAVIAQNIQDIAGINKQFPILWRKFDVDPEGGVDSTGRIMAMLYDSEEGHGQEPLDMSKPLLDMATAHFEGPIHATGSVDDMPDGKKKKNKGGGSDD